MVDGVEDAAEEEGSEIKYQLSIRGGVGCSWALISSGSRFGREPDENTAGMRSWSATCSESPKRAATRKCDDDTPPQVSKSIHSA